MRVCVCVRVFVYVCLCVCVCVCVCACVCVWAPVRACLVSSLTIAKRPGVCPRILTFAPCVYKPYQPNQCFHDYQCKVNEKCCSTPCGPRRCKRVIVATPVCPYVTETTCRLKCRERGGLATDKKGCRVCQCASELGSTHD